MDRQKIRNIERGVDDRVKQGARPLTAKLVSGLSVIDALNRPELPTVATIRAGVERRSSATTIVALSVTPESVK
jgi:hypothetical protein